MSRLPAFFCSTVFLIACSAQERQYFEGNVTLEIQIESNHERLPEDLLYSWYGKSEYRTYKGGDFRIDYREGELASLWYFRKENREYILRTCDDYIAYDDVGTPKVDVVSVQKIEGSREIAGYSAKALEIREVDEDGEITILRYWYAPDLEVDPDWFSNYRVGGANRVYEYIDSLIVGYESESPYSSVRKFATKIILRPVSDPELALPDIESRLVTFEDAVELPPCAND